MERERADRHVVVQRMLLLLKERSTRMSMFREVEEYDEDSDSECEYTTPYTLSAELAELIGQKRVARHSVVKRIGIIIKERRLLTLSTESSVSVTTTFSKCSGRDVSVSRRCCPGSLNSIFWIIRVFDLI